ncbi:plasmid mobilization protein [Fusobacterium periodonticum]|uniref:plasmid mobilization protein n=1 Tax=Fusobacterium periodonticum TaxID=860 RepID=UPI00195EA90F|nr:plasmid mobilization relaxosome protein MobC [Fusobacterium periodonticum]VTX90596.1 Bacterial mobilisation protein (MobC) [Fusobacterium periodonticum]
MYTKKKEFKIDEELEKIIAVQTDKLNLSMSEYIRQLIKQDYILEDTEVIADFKTDLKTTIKELNAIGKNLNQLARYTNTQKKMLSVVEIELMELVEKLQNVFKKL